MEEETKGLFNQQYRIRQAVAEGVFRFDGTSEEDLVEEMEQRFRRCRRQRSPRLGSRLTSRGSFLHGAREKQELLRRSSPAGGCAENAGPHHRLCA